MTVEKQNEPNYKNQANQRTIEISKPANCVHKEKVQRMVRWVENWFFCKSFAYFSKIQFGIWIIKSKFSLEIVLLDLQLITV